VSPDQHRMPPSQQVQLGELQHLRQKREDLRDQVSHYFEQPITYWAINDSNHNLT
jgi:hypothetical protein